MRLTDFIVFSFYVHRAPTRTDYNGVSGTLPGLGRRYGIKITIDNTGRLFAFLVTAPERTFAQEKQTFDAMLGSFKTYKSESQFV